MALIPKNTVFAVIAGERMDPQDVAVIDFELEITRAKVSVVALDVALSLVDVQLDLALRNNDESEAARLRSESERLQDEISNTLDRAKLAAQTQANVAQALASGFSYQFQSTPPLPDGMVITASRSLQTRVIASGTPASSSGNLHIVTATIGGLTVGSVTLQIAVRNQVIPATTVTTKAVQTRQAGRNHTAFSIATVVGNVTEDEISVSGHEELGLRASFTKTDTGHLVDTWDIRLFGFIPARIPARRYSIRIVAAGVFATYSLNVTAAPVTPVTPTAVTPPYWEGNPGTVTITQGARISSANPIFVGSIRQVDGLAVTVSSRPS